MWVSKEIFWHTSVLSLYSVLTGTFSSSVASRLIFYNNDPWRTIRVYIKTASSNLNHAVSADSFRDILYVTVFGSHMSCINSDLLKEIPFLYIYDTSIVVATLLYWRGNFQRWWPTNLTRLCSKKRFAHLLCFLKCGGAWYIIYLFIWSHSSIACSKLYLFP